MLRRFLFLSVGALALLVVLQASGQLHAPHMRGGFPSGAHPGFRSGVMPGFRGGFDPRFNRNFFFAPRFNPRFSRGALDRFEDRFENRFGSGRFDRFEDRFESRFNRGFFDPRFSPGFFPGSVFPF